MNTLLQLFDIQNTFFTILGYQMSYIEFFGTIFNLACVYLVARKHILNWPIGIIGVVLFAALFYQLNLYADLFEQVYYFVTGFIGWYLWIKARKNQEEKEDIVIERNTKRVNIAWIGGMIVGTIVLTYVMTHLNVWLPKLFPEAASLPLLDTATTVMSFAAQILLVKRRVESWVLWVIVDVIAIGLYWYKQVPLVAILYAIFLVIACNGLITWHKAARKE